MHPSLILPETTLVAIVRDEEMNPAGGIVDFVEWTVPFVEYAFIVDTGSKDNTYTLLKRLQRRHKNLVVQQREFDGFVNSRNYTLDEVRTRFTLILDADERISPLDFAHLRQHLTTKAHIGFFLNFINIGEYSNPGNSTHNPRLFRTLPEIRYVEKGEGEEYWMEIPRYRGKHMFDHNLMYRTDCNIRHYLPSDKARSTKVENWYKRVFRRRWYDFFYDDRRKKLAPSETEGFQEWKSPNPLRETDKGFDRAYIESLDKKASSGRTS